MFLKSYKVVASMHLQSPFLQHVLEVNQMPDAMYTRIKIQRFQPKFCHSNSRNFSLLHVCIIFLNESDVGCIREHLLNRMITYIGGLV